MSYIGTKKIKSVYIGTQKVKSVYVGTNKVYSSGPVVEPYLTFTALQANSSVGFVKYGSPNSVDLQCSLDKVNWTSWGYGATKYLHNVGDKIYVKNTTNNFSKDNNNYYKFSMSGKIKASGDISSLINYADTPSNAFYNLLSVTSLYDITELKMPSTTNFACFREMFSGSSITETCDLPAEVLSNYCYDSMFKGCSLLTTIRPLPATTLADLCYTSMFEKCTSLTTPPQFYANVTYANQCFTYMFQGCSNLKVASYQATGKELHIFFHPSSTLDWRMTTGMFKNTGGVSNGGPSANETWYYYYN